MRKSFVFIVLLAMTLASCVKPEDISNILAQIDELKSDKIASVESQIAKINSSITSLQNEDKALKEFINTLQQQREELVKADEKLASDILQIEKELEDAQATLNGNIDAAKADVLAQLNAYKATVEAQIQSLNAAIENLQKQGEELQKQIDNLKTYVDTQINNTKDWATNTFATLAAYNATADIVASIQTQIETINAQIKELWESVAGVTKKELEDAISGLDTNLQGKINQAVEDCNAAISASEEKITAAYNAAISKAISESEASIKDWVNNQLTSYYTIAQMDAMLGALQSNLEGQLASQKTYLEGLISGLQTTLSNKIDANKTLIEGLQSQVNQLSADLSVLGGKVATNAANISNNAKAISDNASAILKNAGDIDACEKLIAANKKLIEENTAAINANDKDIADLQTRASADEKLIADNAAAIAKNASDIAKNGELIAANATAISNNAKAISDNAGQIVQLKADLAQAKVDITAAYTKAIATAITELDGKLSGQIATEVATLNTRIDNEVKAINATIEALTARVATCEKDIKSIKQTIYGMQQDIEELQEQVAAILARIQSISFVPRYSDGKAIMTYTNNGTITPGIAEFDFELKPSSTAAELVKVWRSAVSMSAVYTITKAAPETVALAVENVTAENGYITVVVSGKGLKDEYFLNQCSANVRLSISDGNNDKVSEYVQMIPWTTDVISFADAAFKAYLVENFDTSGDGEISDKEALAVTEINASMLNIASVTGIEYFKNLTNVDLSYNKLTTVDLSHSVNLQSVDVSGNKITNLDVDGLSKLVSLNCSSNKIDALNVSESPLLEILNCNNNQIGSLVLNNNKELTELQCNSNLIAVLDLKNNTKLKTLYCRKNALNALDVTPLTDLTDLDFSANEITSINLYKNTSLENLYCSNNQFTALDVALCTNLMTLDCSSNTLASLNISKNALLETLNCSKNNLTRLDASKNENLKTLTCDGNAEMSKLWLKNESHKEAISIKKDVATVICYCNGGIQIPDAKLKAYLVANYDDDADGEISIAESENITNVNCSGKGVASIEGLDYCENLQVLDISNNTVSRILLPGLKKLTTVKCFENPVSEIDLSNCTAMQHCYLQSVGTDAFIEHNFRVNGYNQASSLKLNLSNTSQYNANIDDSSVLQSVDVSSFTTLKGISTNRNTELTQVTYPSQTLREVYATGCPLLTGIDVTACQSLTKIEIRDSGLTELDVTQNAELETLYIERNQLSALDVTHNTKLVDLTAHYNQILSIDVTNCPELKHLDIGGNKLSAINVRSNPLLDYLSVSANTDITILNVDKNPLLTTLNASYTSITDLALAANTALKTLNVSGCASMTTIDISKSSELSSLACNDGIHVVRGSMVNPLSSLTAKWAYIDNEKLVFFTHDNKVKAISLDEASHTWGYYGTKTAATSTTDGAANTDIIASGSTAAKWCRGKGASWYLPATEELSAINKAKSTLNSILSTISGTQLKGNYYWSSTETDSGKACAYNFNGGYLYDTTKSNYCYVRAVRVL